MTVSPLLQHKVLKADRWILSPLTLRYFCRLRCQSLRQSLRFPRRFRAYLMRWRVPRALPQMLHGDCLPVDLVAHSPLDGD